MIDAVDYLKENPLPPRGDDIEPVYQAIYDFIDTIGSNLYIHLFYFYDSMMHYIIYQEELSYGELKRYIQDILINTYDIFNIRDIWLYDNSPLRNYIDIDELDNKAYKSNESIESKLIEYKALLINTETTFNIEELLKQHARTEAAKRYFNIKEE